MKALEVSPARPRHDSLAGILNGDGDAKRAESEIGALKAENAELRKVVIALSRLVIRNVLRGDARP
jgi:hypothetical protein